MKWQEIAARVTSLGFLGASVGWKPPVPDVTRARAIIAHLEDRRILYYPEQARYPVVCLDSVNRLRTFLTEQLSEKGPPGAELATILRAMRAACRKFTDRLEPHARAGELPDMDPVMVSQYVGELRGDFGWLIGALAARYRLDVEDHLASIIPETD
jgi:hypothetical protein